MSTDSTVFPFNDVVIVADIFPIRDWSNELFDRRDLEMTDIETLDALVSAIENIGLNFHHYSTPEELASNADSHKQDIVFTIYGGESSRNRMALVPAICETYNLMLVGPDVYGRIVAQDKELSKRLARECGLHTPVWYLIRELVDIDECIECTHNPVVIKPIFEGSSIGISQNNLVTNKNNLAKKIASLLDQFEQPVLVEEFVAGREVAYSKIQGGAENAWTYTEVVVPGQPNYFEDKLLDIEEKWKRSDSENVALIDSELKTSEKYALDKMLGVFGAYGYARVDGRLNKDGFNFIEISPDAWIDPSGQFANGFIQKGWTYETVIMQILLSSNQSLRGS